MSSKAVHYLRLIEESLAQEPIAGTPAELYAPIDYMLAMGGKRLRPMLVLFGYGLFQKDVSPAIRPALSVELLHNFTLIHDDIMDDAPLRRGQPSVHAQWDVNTAILSGDALLIKGYTMFSGVSKDLLPEVLSAFNDCALRVCEGQQMDLIFEKMNQVNEQEYVNMIRLKTGYLLGFCLELGALLAGASAALVQEMRHLGQQIGIMFQLKDDVLDVYGQTTQVGKRLGGDIISNKKTFLLVCAMQQAQGEARAVLLNWLRRDEFDEEEKVAAVRAIYDKLNIKAKAEARIYFMYQACEAALEGLSADSESKAALQHYVRELFRRKF